MPVLPITGVTQNYAWGGQEFIANFLQQPNPDQSPIAEYWLGAHPKGPAKIEGEARTLDAVLATRGAELLGTAVAQRFAGKLPFLFKILDVKDMLSIQVHPTKRAAEIGFAQEEENGPDRSAPDRNYRDDNHKPELGVALTDFYLLHGFRPAADIRPTLVSTPKWDTLLDTLDRQGVKGLYRKVMEASQAEVDALLAPLVAQLGDENDYERHQPEFWAARAVKQYSRDGHHDRGIFSIYWFNIVHLTPGEGIFQDAGIPHAYLEGVCIELMANSDNVLRGGLTPKHIDVPELLNKTNTNLVVPEKLLPQAGENGWLFYPTPAPDFKLSLAQVHNNGQLTVTGGMGPAILLLLQGSLQSLYGKTVLSEDSRTLFVPAGESISFTALEESTVYLASTGDLA